MREFFKGWRRKLGVVTLVLACVITAGWVRSQYVTDEIYLSSSLSLQRVINEQGVFGHRRLTVRPVKTTAPVKPFSVDLVHCAVNGIQTSYVRVLYVLSQQSPWIRWNTRKPDEIVDAEWFPDVPRSREWSLMGMKYTQKQCRQKDLHAGSGPVEEITDCSIPHWSIDLPLTLLSAYLLLSKPRPATATKTSESKPVAVR